ncbi:conserved hypothetical protein [Acidobacteriia bacterium SbA2]|nr:conserved hypothetical protein [Acidobacteriia bacterium SbA2]
MPPGTTYPEERAELDRVLASQSFAKSPNLSRLLKYLCEKCFEGGTEDLNEYSIAVDALGRTADFDPGISSIVRVEAHRLRDKLSKYYEGEGARHPMMILLEAGRYAPQFVKRDEAASVEGEKHASGSSPPVSDTLRGGAFPSQAVAGDSAVPTETVKPGSTDSEPPASPRQKIPLPLLVVGMGLLVLGVVAVSWRSRNNSSEGVPARSGEESIAAPLATSDEIRILAGYSKQNFIDRRGKIWGADRYFKGGQPFTTEQQPITRTLDQTIFRQSRAGEFTYDIPLKKGPYELRLYFAESQFGPTTFAGGGETSRIFAVDMNGGPLLEDFDIYTSAGGSNIAYERVFKDVTRASDGYLHLRFRPTSREKPILNALEILPGIPGKLRPIRLVAREDSYTDHEGRLWSPDCYFMHGRFGQHTAAVQNTPDPDLYTAERFGNFDYAIPVATGTYAVTLRFAETYFGELNSGFGSKGSRVFDVFCNGVTLLHNFDIFKEAGGANRALDKTFHGLEPDAHGLLRLSFVPSRNYAMVNAIEVVDESR